MLSSWRESWEGSVSTPEDMVRFIDDVGCCMNTPMIAYPDFPSQAAVIGEVEAGTMDTWFWKDDLHIEKRLYYTRVFGGKPGFVSLRLLPALIATNGMVADEMLFAGIMSVETQQIYNAIESHGPIPIRVLKGLLTPEAKHVTDSVLQNLERRFIITKTGITGRTRGTYGYVWDLVERWMPEMLAAADNLGRPAAEAMIREHLASFGVQPHSRFYSRVLDWKPSDLETGK